MTHFFLRVSVGVLIVLVANAQETSDQTRFAAPQIAKSFNPASISANEFVTFAIAFSNANSQVARFTEPFIEELPPGVQILGSPSNSCGGTLTATKGSSTITLSNARIPGNGVCQILVGVTALKPGSFKSKTPALALQTNVGNNQTPRAATLTVVSPR